ncbi:Nitroreductase family protein [Alteromonadaceae bacterium Bs31]|nr:Nitroreductase family protein [Alteromonadaceae bacterium Bs31]
MLGAGANSQAIDACFWQRVLAGISAWQGEANLISQEHAYWPQIANVLPAIEKKNTLASVFNSQADKNTNTLSNYVPEYSESCSTVELISKRRSAQRMELGEGISKGDFYRMLALAVPTGNRVPFDAFPYSCAVNLLLFVHKVEGLPAGLYTLIRNVDSFDAFKEACNKTFFWQPVQDCDLPLYCLELSDLRKTASALSCYQAIAGHSAFSVAMIANIQTIMTEDGAWAYRRLFWEAGLIGQLLYLEALASGLSGTGIGCYFDDAVHKLLGLANEGDWQSLYHFTVGKAREDNRLTTYGAYSHLSETEC